MDFGKFVSRNFGVAGGAIAALLAIPTADPFITGLKVVGIAAIAVAYCIAQAGVDRAEKSSNVTFTAEVPTANVPDYDA